MKFHCNVHCFDAIFTSQNAPNSIISGSLPRTLLGTELTALPQIPIWWGGGSLPLPKTPAPLRASAFGPRIQHTHSLFQGAAYGDWVLD